MKITSVVLKVALVLLLIGAFAIGTLCFADKPPKRCDRDPNVTCTDIYDPVICNDGVVYSNGCYAWKACAHGCKPYRP